MTTFFSTALLSLLLSGPQVASDTTITVAAGTRLDVETRGGEIVVDTWDRSEVRIQAEHGSRDEIRVTRSGDVIRVRSDSRRRAVGIVDYRITVPASMDLELSGMNASISVNGSRGQVRAKTVNGSISVTGGVDQVVVETVQGSVTVEGARAAVRARAVGGRVRVANVIGPVDAETVSGGVILEGIESSQVNASAVSGGIYFDGPIANGGSYSFVSHSGGITISMPSTPNATITVATLSGSVSSSIPEIAAVSVERGRRQRFVIGSGGANVEAESFSGSIRLVRRGEVAPPGQRGRGAL